jgi:hypothetical protein
MRWLFVLVAVVCALAAAAPVYAQDPTPSPEATAEPEATVEPEQTAEPEQTTTPEDACARGGSDADYAYCNPCQADAIDYGADGDYAYCPSGPQFSDGRGGERKNAAAAPVSAISGLPLTGINPFGLALFGLAFLLTGVGLRLKWSRP